MRKYDITTTKLQTNLSEANKAFALAKQTIENRQLTELECLLLGIIYGYCDYIKNDAAKVDRLIQELMAFAQDRFRDDARYRDSIKSALTRHHDYGMFKRCFNEVFDQIAREQENTKAVEIFAGYDREKVRKEESDKLNNLKAQLDALQKQISEQEEAVKNL